MSQIKTLFQSFSYVFKVFPRSHLLMLMKQGNFFSEWGDAEGRSNFALWCLMKAPLILGTDLTNMTAATLATITNKAAIAVNKDPLAEQGVLRTSQWLPTSKHTDPENNLPFGHMVVSWLV